jgi:hypothetical protein
MVTVIVVADSNMPSAVFFLLSESLTRKPFISNSFEVPKRLYSQDLAVNLKGQSTGDQEMPREICGVSKEQQCSWAP